MPILITSFQSLVRERQSLAKREHTLIAALNRVLPRFGYSVVPASGADGVRVGRTVTRTRRTATRRRSLVCQ